VVSFVFSVEIAVLQRKKVYFTNIKLFFFEELKNFIGQH